MVIDIPVGETAKVRTLEKAKELKAQFEIVGQKIGLKLKVVITDGTQPVGRGIGPALEAMDVLNVLRNETDAPMDLKQRALSLAGIVLELSGNVKGVSGVNQAAEILSNGMAYKNLSLFVMLRGVLQNLHLLLTNKI